MKKKIIIYLLIIILLVTIVFILLVKEKPKENVKKEKIEVKVKEKKDNIKPEIVLKGESEVNIVENSEYVEKGYTATDNIDGDITKNVIIRKNILKQI